MKNSSFLIFMLVLFSGFCASYAVLSQGLSPVRTMQAKLEHSERARAQADLRVKLSVARMADFQQQVATLIPGATKGLPETEAYPLRQLASVVGDGEKLAIERASGVFEKAKAAFRDKQFEESNEMLADLIARYPDSVHVIEAHFLLAEGEFQLGENESSVETIEKMVSVYPESELTGFALLRLGKIFEVQERLDDAGDIYRAVAANFKQPEIHKQALSSLKAVAL